MNGKIFRDYLVSKGFAAEDIEKQVDSIKKIEINLQQSVTDWTLDDLNPSSVQILVDELIDTGENTFDNLLTMLRYAKAIGNQAMFTTLFEMLDGCEAMDNLYEKLAMVAGDELRDIVFEGLPLPPLGLSKQEKARYTYRIMHRIENIFDERVCREILSDSLRDLPDAYYADDRKDFYQTCESDIDRYLQFKGQKFLDTLIDYQSRNELFFGQEITDNVIQHVRNNPEIGGGIRNGQVIYETKIPYNTIAYLEETDPDIKRFHYCHCSWVRESVRRGTLKISATFCNCSAGFHKKPYEVIFDKKLRAEVLQSVLKGDSSCRFAIYLPGDEGSW